MWVRAAAATLAPESQPGFFIASLIDFSLALPASYNKDVEDNTLACIYVVYSSHPISPWNRGWQKRKATSLPQRTFFFFLTTGAVNIRSRSCGLITYSLESGSTPWVNCSRLWPHLVPHLTDCPLPLPQPYPPTLDRNSASLRGGFCSQQMSWSRGWGTLQCMGQPHSKCHDAEAERPYLTNVASSPASSFPRTD